MPPDTSWMDALPDVTLPGQAAPAPAPATTATAHPSFPMVAPHPAPDNSGAMTNLSDEDYGKFMRGDSPPAGAATAASPSKDTSWMDALPDVVLPKDMPAPKGGGGILANVGAGTSETVANTLGAPVDLATGAMNLVPRGINAVAGTNIPTIQNPVGGSDWMKNAFGFVGANPNTVQANSEAEKMARAGGAGAASMLLPMGAARALPALSGIPGAVQQMVGAGGAPTMGVAGAAGGAAGQLAQDSVPEPYKPLADLAGNVIGGGIPIGLRAAAGAATQAVAPTVSRFAAPLMAGGREAMAGQRILGAASDPGAVQDALANQSPALVPGSQPTTYQMTGDQGLGNLERVAAQNAPDQFLQRAGEQNAARVAAIPGQSETASPAAIGAAFRQHLADIDTAGEQAVGAARGTAQGATEALGGAVPSGADQQTTALQAYGQRLRGPLDEANQDQRARVSKLYNAVDPDGTLAVDMTGIKQAARGIANDIPKNAAPMQGDAGSILGVMQMQPKAQPFREVQALRGRITDAMREELYNNGRSQTYRRLSQMLAPIDDTLANGVEAAAGKDSGVAERFAAIGENGGPLAGAGNRQGAAQVSAGGAAGGGGTGGVGSSAAERLRTAGSNSAVEAPAAAGRKPESLVDFLIARGGVQDQGGDLRAIGADTIHHRQGGRLVNARGVPLDYAREAAEEAGFLKPNSTTTDLLNAVADHAAGRPVYRISEQAQGDAMATQASDAARQAHAVERARYDVGMAETDLGARLTQPQMDYAVRLRMEGEHPHEAIHQAVRSDEEEVLQRNAEQNAFGRSGVPLAAQQAEMPDTGTWLTPNFTPEAAARYRAANAAHAQRAQTFENAPGVGQALASGQRKGEWKLGDSQVAATIFNAGKGAAERIQAFLKAGGDNAGLVSDLKDYAAFDLRRAAEDADGTLNPAKTQKWLKAHAEALSAFPETAAAFRTAASARTAMDEAAASHLAAREAFEKSAASKFLGDADPTATVGRILKSDTADATMRQLGAMTAKDPAAREGLRKAVADYMLQELRSNSLAGDTTERAFKSDTFQTFIRRAAPALRHIMEPEEIEGLQNIAADLQQANRSIVGTKLPGGSNTAQDLAAGEKHSGGKPSVVGTLVAMEAAGEVMHHMTGNVGRIAGMVAAPVFNAMRAHGLAKVDDLVTEAMLHPNVARALIAKVPPGAFAKPVWQNAARQITALGATSAMRGMHP